MQQKALFFPFYDTGGRENIIKRRFSPIYDTGGPRKCNKSPCFSLCMISARKTRPRALLKRRANAPHLGTPTQANAPLAQGRHSLTRALPPRQTPTWLHPGTPKTPPHPGAPLSPTSDAVLGSEVDGKLLAGEQGLCLFYQFIQGVVLYVADAALRVCLI